MRTTFEFQPKKSGINERALLDKLHNLPNIWNTTLDLDNASISFEYLTTSDLEVVRRELHELGCSVINDTGRFDAPENHP
jgi:hypothetical protein